MDLVSCSKCGNIQDETGVCGKCGSEIVAEPPEAVAADSKTINETGEPIGASRPARVGDEGLRLAIEESGQDPQDRGAAGDKTGQTQDAGLSSEVTVDPGRFLVQPVFMPIGRLITMSLVTFGLYQFFWFNRTWKILRAYSRPHLEPGNLTWLLLVPFYNFYLVYNQWKDVNTMVMNGKDRGFPVVPVFIGWLVLSAWVCLAAKIEAGFLFFSPWFASVFFLVPVQAALNRYGERGCEAGAMAGSHGGWTAGAVVLTCCFLFAGVYDSAMRHKAMKTFRNEAAGLGSDQAFTGEETRALLLRYGSFIGRSKSMMNAKGFLRDEKDEIYQATSNLIGKLPEKLHCVRPADVVNFQANMYNFIEKDNKYLIPALSGMSADMARLKHFMSTDYFGRSPKDNLDECKSEPFDVQSFMEEIRQKENESASGPKNGKSGRRHEPPPEVPEDAAISEVKTIALLLKEHYKTTGGLIDDVHELLQQHGNKIVRNHRAQFMIANHLRRDAIHISTDGNSYRIGIELNKTGRSRGQQEFSRWVVCSGVIGKDETTQIIEKAPSGVIP